MKDIYVCNSCGGEDVQAQSYTNVNTGEFIEYITTPVEDNEGWCDYCQDNITIINKNNFDYNAAEDKAEIIGDVYMDKADIDYERNNDK